MYDIVYADSCKDEEGQCHGNGHQVVGKIPEMQHLTKPSLRKSIGKLKAGLKTKYILLPIIDYRVKILAEDQMIETCRFSINKRQNKNGKKQMQKFQPWTIPFHIGKNKKYYNTENQNPIHQNCGNGICPGNKNNSVYSRYQ